MKNIETIAQVMDEILQDEIDYLTLKNKLEDFKSLLIRLTELDLEVEGNRQDIQFENGIALNTISAAMCVEDIMRTRQFVRGIYKAVRQVKAQKSKPVSLLYAGTGPFATLALPVLTKFTPDELQLILLDVNPQTLKHLEQLIRQLGIENYIERIICKDASKYKFEEGTAIDILVSETMQHGLVKEQQVPIMMNLTPQLPEEAIIIPNKIRLDLALMNSNDKLLLEGKVDLKYKSLKNILNFDKKFIYSYIKNTPLWSKNQRFELCQQIPFRENNDNEYDKVVILTSIQVYDEEWIKVDASGLTMPKILFDLQRLTNEKKELSLSYVVSKNPDFEFELN